MSSSLRSWTSSIPMILDASSGSSACTRANTTLVASYASMAALFFLPPSRGCGLIMREKEGEEEGERMKLQRRKSKGEERG